MNKRGVTLFYIIGIIAVLLARSFSRMIDGGIWAEDGPVFIGQAYSSGLESFLLPYAGYFLTLSRIGAYIAVQFPVAWVPYVVFLFCLAFTVYVFSMFLSERFAYIIPSIHHRGLIALTLCTIPGLSEIFGNVTNLHWLALFYIGLMGLADSTFRIRIAELIVVLVCIASDGASIILLPLFVIRYLFIWLKVGPTTNRHAYLLIISVILGLFIGTITLQTEKPAIDIVIIFRVFLTSLSYDMLARPFLGKFTSTLNHFWDWSWICILVCFFLFLLVKGKGLIERKFVFLWVFVFCFSMFPVMVTLVRYANCEFFLAQNYGLVGFRYSFIPGAAGIVLWSAIIEQVVVTSKAIKTGMYVFLFLFSVVLISCYSFQIKPYYPKGQWKSMSPLITSVLKTGNPREIVVPISPDGWAVIIQHSKEE